MNLTIEYIRKLIQHGEGVDVEFKETTGQLRRGMETLCGMLNGNGGLVVFGITNQGKIVGQEVSDKTTREIGEVLGKFEPSVNIQPIYILLENSEKQLIAFYSDGKANNKPYMWDGKAYRRHDSVTSTMTRDDIMRMHEQTSGFYYHWEKDLNYDITFSDLDDRLIENMVQTAVKKGRLTPDALNDSIPTLLERLELTKGGILTNASVVLFSNNLSGYPQSMLRLARFKGSDKMVFIDNRQVTGNIFELLNAGMSFFFKHLNLHGTTHNRLERHDELEIPYDALRECLINSLCHRAWQNESHSVGIAIYDDRIEVENAGRFPYDISPSLLTRDELEHKANTSNPPNKIIANVLYLAGKIEHWGRGLSMMRNKCLEFGLHKPEILENGPFVYVKFRRPEPGVSIFDLQKDTSTDQVGHKPDTSWIQAGHKLNTSLKQAESPIIDHLASINLKLIKAIGEDWLSANELINLMGFKSRSSFMKNYLIPNIKEGLIMLENPSKPSSPYQRYGLTLLGKKLYYSNKSLSSIVTNKKENEPQNRYNDPQNHGIGPQNDLQDDPQNEKINLLIKLSPRISRKELADKLGVSESTIKRRLKELGIYWQGHPKTGHWLQL